MSITKARAALGAAVALLLACALPAAAGAAPPTVTITPPRAPDHGGGYNHAVVFTATSTTPGATCDAPVTYSGPNSATASVTMHCAAKGEVGTATRSFKYDSTPPVTTATLDPPSPNGLNGWYVGPVTLTLDSVDRDSGVSTLKMNG